MQRRRWAWFKSESLGSDLMGILLQVINASMKAMDRQLEEFKDEFRRTSCQATEGLEKRLKTGRSLDFRRKGNELQYLFNEEVDRKLDEVEKSLKPSNEEGNPSCEVTCEEGSSSTSGR